MAQCPPGCLFCPLQGLGCSSHCPTGFLVTGKGNPALASKMALPFPPIFCAHKSLLIITM